MTPYTAAQVRQRQTRKRKRLNRRIAQCRIEVEHIIRELKLFRVIGSLYRHPREKMAQLVELCGGLAVRKLSSIQML